MAEGYDENVGGPTEDMPQHKANHHACPVEDSSGERSGEAVWWWLSQIHLKNLEKAMLKTW